MSSLTEKLGAGTAFESVASHYERDELPHTPPCHKIILTRTDFPTSTAHDLNKRNVLVFHLFPLCRLLTHHHFTLLLSSLSVACIILAARKAHRRFIKGMLADLFKRTRILYRYISNCQEKISSFLRQVLHKRMILDFCLVISGASSLALRSMICRVKLVLVFDERMRGLAKTIKR